jgi:hypothetical protein
MLTFVIIFSTRWYLIGMLKTRSVPTRPTHPAAQQIPHFSPTLETRTILL